MKNNNDPIRQENKRALPKFVLISVGGIILGAVLGVALVFLNVENFADTLDSAGRLFAVHGAPWLLMALPLVELALCLPIYFSAKKQLSVWDGEDEAVSDQVEARLSVCLWITGLCTVLALFLLAALFAGFAANAGTPQMMPAPMFFGSLAGFLADLFVPLILQQKLVDLTKKLYPEKRGSVYDPRFQKKWLDSCDEAERALIGRCAMKAYQAMTYTCLGLWVVFALGGMFFNWGFLPALAVCVVWGVGQSVYAWWTLKLGKSGGSVY